MGFLTKPQQGCSEAFLLRWLDVVGAYPLGMRDDEGGARDVESGLDERERDEFSAASLRCAATHSL